ncbi:MAG TPA: hypothetical protein VNQ90_11050 [Chthoniobacteraceae bacterium]|nr:hypothetical protein [Chthoniobacteraceae bacterium]
MKVAQILGLLLLPMTVLAGDTAYEALRTVGTDRDRELLNRVVEVKGESGVPQPETWVIVIDDPLARGGVREIEVAGGRVVSERTPVKKYSGISAGSAMNFERLNLDSKGAFTIAEQEAKIARVSFDAVDYVLRRDEDRGFPVWRLQLLDPELRRVATLTIAADTGAVLNREFQSLARVGDAQHEEDEVKEYIETGKEEGKHLGRRIERTFRRVGGSLEEFFTGKRTIDRSNRDGE